MPTVKQIQDFCIEEINKLELDLGGEDKWDNTPEDGRKKTITNHDAKRRESFKCGRFISLAKILHKTGYQL